MAKKSFLLHIDSLIVLPEMSNEQAGIFIKAIYHYQMTGELIELDFGLKMAITPFINQFKRDNEMYEITVNKRRIAGAKGGKQKVANASKSKHKVAKVADNVNDNVNDNKNNNIEERKLKFADTLKPFIDKFGRPMVNDFYRYWTQPNNSNTKFKRELEKTWDLSLRLDTWARNDKSTFGKTTEQKLEPKLNMLK